MLTPSAEDPNRETELKRKERQPETFMPDNTIKDWKPSGLTSVDGVPLNTDPRRKNKC